MDVHQDQVRPDLARQVESGTSIFRLTHDAIRITDQDTLERLASVWATTWDGRWKYLVRDGCFYQYDEHEVLPDAICVFKVVPTKVFAFAKGNFSHTRHQF